MTKLSRSLLFIVAFHVNSPEMRAQQEIQPDPALAEEMVDPDVVSVVSQSGEIIVQATTSPEAVPAEPETAPTAEAVALPVEINAEMGEWSEPSDSNTGMTTEAPAAQEAEPIQYESTGEFFVAYSTSNELPANIEQITQSNDKGINIALDNVTLRETVDLFRYTTGAKIMYNPEIFPTNLPPVSYTENNLVDWASTLRSILDLYGYALKENVNGSGYTVKRAEASSTMIKTFFLDYTTSAEIHEPAQRMLKGGISEAAALKFDSRNALIVRSTESNLEELEKLIKELDRPGKQILVEAKIFELSDQASKQLGIKWNSLESFGIRAGAGPFTRTEQTTRDKTSERALSRESERLRTSSENSSRTVGDNRFFDADGNPIVLTETEVIPSGVVGVPGTIVTRPIPTTERTANQNIASDFSTRDSEGSIDSQAESYARQIVESQAAILSMDSFEVILSALEKTDGVSVISNPKMIVTSGSTGAVFKVVDKEPNITTTTERGTTESPGDTITVNVGTPFEIGITLNVTATAKTDDYIEAKINPILARKLGNKVVENNSFPIISSKEIDTTFTLRSGQTVAIGGLTDSEDIKITSKIPILGSLPVIGRFFSHTEDGKKQTETVIFVTLTIANPDSLVKSAGIPEDAKLVRNQLLRAEAEAAKAEADKTEQEEEKTTDKGRRGRSFKK